MDMRVLKFGLYLIVIATTKAFVAKFNRDFELNQISKYPIKPSRRLRLLEAR